MGHPEAARRAFSLHGILTRLTTISGLVAAGTGYAILHRHHPSGTLVEAFIASLVATVIFMRARILVGARMKYHFDRVNMSNLIANWGGGLSERRRERAARIIGRAP